jgi:hypothetical protein
MICACIKGILFQPTKQETGEVRMEAACRALDQGVEGVEEREGTPRTDATFTEIYELISENEIMVSAEWAILLKLVQKKYMERMDAPPCNTATGAHRAYRKQAVAGRRG